MKRQTLITLALGCCAIGAVQVSCNQEQEQQAQAKQQETIPAIKTFPIVVQTVQDTGEWFGYVRGYEDTDIRPRVSGFLMEQCYKDGQIVKKDDILFRIDPVLFQASLDQAKANLEAAKANLASAEASLEKTQLDLKRYEQLIKTSAVSGKELDDARQNNAAALANVEAAKAQIAQQEAAVKTAQIDLDYCQVKAPYDGIVGAAQAFQGDLVSPSTLLANMTSLSPMLVRFSVNSENLIQAFRREAERAAKGPVKAQQFELILDNGDIYPLKGEIVAMESKISDSGLMDIQGEIDNPNGLLRAGMSVRVRIALNEREALLVPPVAIRKVMRQSFILVVAKDGTPRMVPVEVQGTYKVNVTEANGYSSEQNMVAVSSKNVSLKNFFRDLGYDNAQEVPVVADADNAVTAVNISSANSRLAKGEQPRTIKTAPYTFQPTLPPALQAAIAQAKAEKAGEAKPPVDPATLTPTLPPFPVKVAPLLQQDVAEEGEWFGTVRGINETGIRPRVNGFILSQNFEDGSLVKKGDVLYTIDPAPYQAALENARANLAAAKASVKQCEAQVQKYQLDVNRYDELQKKSPGAVSDKTITDAKTNLKTGEASLLKAQATVKQMEAAVRQAEINLSYTTIVAPFDGRVGIHTVSKGELVSDGQTQPLVTISSVNPMRVDFEISGADALDGLTQAIKSKRNNKAGTNARQDAFTIVLEDGSIYPARGEIVTADNSINESTGTLKVIGQVDDVDGGLRSGLPVRVRAGLKKQKGAYLVPARAPMFGNGQNVVVLLNENNAPVMLPVTLGGLVNIPVKGPDGKEIVQPMRIIDVNRTTTGALMCAVADAPSTEAMVLGQAGVKDWGELLLKREGASSFRELVEKEEGKALPDGEPAQAGVKDWGELLLKRRNASNYRELVLRDADAKDELDLIAQAQGNKDLMEMMLKKEGIADISKARVVAEGSLMAASQTYAANQAAGAPVNTLTPIDFQYTAPQTVVPSVTADVTRNAPVPPPSGGGTQPASSAEQPASNSAQPASSAAQPDTTSAAQPEQN